MGLALKLVILPAAYFWVYPSWAGSLGGVPAIVLNTLLLEAAMASQITGGLIAAEQRLEPELARLMVGLSIPLSLVTVKIWSLFLPTS